MSAHKHAKLMADYAQDAQETETPWERWQYRHRDIESWKNSDGPVHFYFDFDYRRKPRTININGIEVPEPMREKPENRQIYFIVTAFFETAQSSWNNMKCENQWLSRGICHLTREAAELHAKALLSFTQKQ